MNATATGFLAILMWSLLALLTALTGRVPAFQLVAMAMFVGALSGMVSWPVRRFDPRRLRLPPAVWATGILGLFGYHFFYFIALRNAPAAPASLIAYLWPMLIVVGSALLPGERLRWYHLFGAALGLCGAALLLLRNGWEIAGGNTGFGYASAFLCALIWSSYSILSRRQKSAPSDAVAIYCLSSAIMAGICHLLFEETVWPAGFLQWVAVAGLGVMPVGLAFYAWDHGVKHGNIQLLGSAAYLAPLLSTVLLVVAGLAEPSASLVAACLLIVGGALIASGRIFREREGAEPSPT
jgi:drug/metabolite transporter (DMT)-like permease